MSWRGADGLDARRVDGPLGLADLLAGEKLAAGIELVAYALEEIPIFGSLEMGSAIHARSLSDAQARVKAMLSLEMIGFFSDLPGSQKFPFAALGLLYPVRSINAPTWIPGMDLSDHASDWREGFAAVMVTDTAFYCNARYHTEGDTPDTLDDERMAEVVGAVRRAVVDLAR